MGLHFNGTVTVARRLSDQPRHPYASTGPFTAGKTTLLRLLVGLIQPEEGTVRAFGTGTRNLDRTALLDAVSVITTRCSSPTTFATVQSET